MTKLDDLLAYEVVEGLTEGQFTAEDYVTTILKRIEKVEPKVHSFITLDTEGALSSAKIIDKKIKEKEEIGQLAGVTIGIKDNISTQGIRTTCASKILENYVPTYDATVIKSMKENDAILLGKLNLDEFGMGSTAEESREQPTRNPWNLDCVPGGSSGGSGAAVAAGEYKWDTYFSNVRENFGEEVKRRILIGSYVLSSGYYGKYYLKARRLRSLLRQELLELFKKYDLLIGPTMPILPFKFGEKIDDPIKMYLVDINTVIANLAGIPAISLPVGFSNGLPIGLQIMAAPF